MGWHTRLLNSPVDTMSQQHLLEAVKAPVYGQAHAGGLIVHGLDNGEQSRSLFVSKCKLLQSAQPELEKRSPDLS